MKQGVLTAEEGLYVAETFCLVTSTSTTPIAHKHCLLLLGEGLGSHGSDARTSPSLEYNFSFAEVLYVSHLRVAILMCVSCHSL